MVLEFHYTRYNGNSIDIKPRNSCQSIWNRLVRWPFHYKVSKQKTLWSSLSVFVFFFNPFFHSLCLHSPFFITLTARHCNALFFPLEFFVSSFFVHLFCFRLVVIFSCFLSQLSFIIHLIIIISFYAFVVDTEIFQWDCRHFISFKTAIEFIIESSAFQSSKEMLLILLIVLSCLLHVPSNNNKFHCFLWPIPYHFSTSNHCLSFQCVDAYRHEDLMYTHRWFKIGSSNWKSTKQFFYRFLVFQHNDISWQ